MLKTPLGDIEITIDNKVIDYNFIKCINDKTCPHLDGRFFIQINFVPDGYKHTLHCFIKNHNHDPRDRIESGERLELKSFYSGTTKLSIGVEGESAYQQSGTKVSDYDYDCVYTQKGVSYIILPFTVTTIYKFGIAWINVVNDINDLETWFGADPFLLPHFV